MPIVSFFQRLTCLFLFTGRSYKQIVTYSRPMEPHCGGLVRFGRSVHSIQYATGIVDPYSIQDACKI